MTHFAQRLVWRSATRSSLLAPGLNLPYADEAPRTHFILRRLRYSEHFGEKFGSIGAKKTLVIFLFLFSQYAWSEISFVQIS